MRIFPKLLLAFFGVALSTLVVGVVGHVGINSAVRTLNQTVEVYLPVIESSRHLLEAQRDLRTSLLRIIIPTLSIEQRKAETELFREKLDHFDKLTQVYISNVQFLEDHEELQSRIEQHIQAWKNPQKEILDSARLVTDDSVSSIMEAVLSRQIDHLQWVHQLENAVQRQKPFSGELDPENCQLGRWLRTFKTGNPDLQQAVAELRPLHQRLHSVGHEINHAIQTRDRQKAAELLQDVVEPTLSSITELFDFIKLVVESDVALLTVATELVFGDESAAAAALSQFLDSEIDRYGELVTIKRQENIHHLQKISTLVNLVIVVGVVLAVLFGFLISRSFANKLKIVLCKVQDTGNGLLRSVEDEPGKDELTSISNEVNQTIRNLKEIVVCIQDSASSVFQTAQAQKTHASTVQDSSSIQEKEIVQISKSSEQLALAMDEIFSETQKLESLLQTAATAAQEMNSSIRSTSESATAVEEETTTIASAVMQVAAGSEEFGKLFVQIEEGAANIQAETLDLVATSEKVVEISETVGKISAATKDAVERASTSAIEKITETAGQNSAALTGHLRVLEDLKEQTSNINAVLAKISHISEETQLLSLNAMIISAQSSDRNSGFGVVASEIKNLAISAETGVREIVAAVTTIQELASSSIETVNEVVTAIAKNSEAVTEAETVLHGVMDSAATTASSAAELSSVANIQKKISDNIMEMIGQVGEKVESSQAALSHQNSGIHSIDNAVQHLLTNAKHLNLSTSEQTQQIAHLAQMNFSVNEFCSKLRDMISEQSSATAKTANSLDVISESVKQNTTELSALVQNSKDAENIAQELQHSVDMFSVVEKSESDVDKSGSDQTSV
jgi:methyl-accepting chemotaxis protein